MAQGLIEPKFEAGRVGKELTPRADGMGRAVALIATACRPILAFVDTDILKGDSCVWYEVLGRC